MPATYRFAQMSDIPTVVELRLALELTSHRNLLTPALAQVAQAHTDYLRRSLGDNFIVALAEDAGGVAAVAALELQSRPPSRRWPNGQVAVLGHVYTRQASRRQGYASTLVKMLICEAQKREVACILLEATADGYPLYKTLGFADVNKQRLKSMELQLLEPLIRLEDSSGPVEATAEAALAVEAGAAAIVRAIAKEQVE